MEHKFLIDLTIKYGLSDERLSKVVDLVYQLGYGDIDDKDFQRAANYACTMNLIDLPMDEVIEQMKKKGY